MEMAGRHPGAGCREIQKNVSAQDHVEARGPALLDLIEEVVCGERDHPSDILVDNEAVSVRGEAGLLHAVHGFAKRPVPITAGDRSCDCIRIDVRREDEDVPPSPIRHQLPYQDGQRIGLLAG